MKQSDPNNDKVEIGFGLKVSQDTIDKIKLMGQDKKECVIIPQEAELPLDLQGDCQITNQIIQDIFQSIDNLPIKIQSMDEVSKQIDQIKERDKIVTEQLKQTIQQAEETVQQLVQAQDKILYEYYQ